MDLVTGYRVAEQMRPLKTPIATTTERNPHEKQQDASSPSGDPSSDCPDAARSRADRGRGRVGVQREDQRKHRVQWNRQRRSRWLRIGAVAVIAYRSEEHTSELQSRVDISYA